VGHSSPRPSAQSTELNVVQGLDSIRMHVLRPFVRRRPAWTYDGSPGIAHEHRHCFLGRWRIHPCKAGHTPKVSLQNPCQWRIFRPSQDPRVGGPIRIIQDKFNQKQHLQVRGLPVAPFLQIDPTIDSINHASQRLGLPLMLKSRTLAYDGRGNYVVRSLSQASEALNALKNKPLYCEKWVPFVKEIAVMVVRSTSGEVRSYPAVETIHKDNICHLVFAPLRSKDPAVADRARAVAEAAIRTFDGAGVFGVEMFLLADGDIKLSCPYRSNTEPYLL
jgi:hypothetical protein